MDIEDFEVDLVDFRKGSRSKEEDLDEGDLGLRMVNLNVGQGPNATAQNLGEVSKPHW